MDVSREDPAVPAAILWLANASDALRFVGGSLGARVHCNTGRKTGDTHGEVGSCVK